MIRLLLSVMAFLFIEYAQGQTNASALKINDKWFNDHGSKGLKVGDKVPDLPLGIVLNNHTGKNNLSEFKGKMVILDFWSLSCSSCIAAFPKMKKLQDEFGDSIQVILVNPFETKQQVEQVFAKRKYTMPDLPCVVAEQRATVSSNTNPLFRYFPANAVPHHAWIDPSGTVRLVGSPVNTYPEKIRAAMKGEPYFILNDESTVPYLQADTKARYYQQLGSLKQTPMPYGSFITPYNNELYGYHKAIIDSAQQSKIVQFINTDLIEIYRYGLNQVYTYPTTKKRKDPLYSPALKRWVDFVVLPADVDTVLYSPTKFGPNQMRNELDVIPGSYCYEQVTPLSMREEHRRQYMVEDLNRYFGAHLGMVVGLEQRETPCYILVRTSSVDKAGTNGSLDLLGAIYEAINGNETLHTLFRENKKNGKPWLIMNETGWDNYRDVNMKLSTGKLNTIEDLRKVLKQYDLDLVAGKRSADFMVIKQVK